MSVIIQYDPFNRMGNRMFQYAFGYILASKTSRSLYHHELPNFGIPIHNVKEVIEPILHTKSMGNQHVDTEALYNHPGTIIIDSYLQKSEYYKNYRDILRAAFNIKKSDPINSDSLVVHIRETDYTLIDCFLGYDFYKSLIDESGFTNIKIVTDNSTCDTVQKLVSDGCSLISEGVVDKFVTHSNDRSMSDLYTLIHSENIALSQSSFSWWGAFLGFHKKIIFPYSTKIGMWSVTPEKDDIDLFFDFNDTSIKYIH